MNMAIKDKVFHVLMLTAVILSVGCTMDTGFTEDESVLLLDKESLMVDAEYSEVTMKVTSNRSWSLVSSAPCNWIDVSQTENINLSRTTSDVNLVLNVAENLWIEERGMEFTVLAGEKTQTFTLTQKGFVEKNRVKVEVPASSSRIVDPVVFSSLGGKRYFNVVANCNWTVSVSPETTAAGVSISTKSGFGDYEGFTVTVNAANKDLDNEKKIVISFLPEGQPPYKYEMTQQKGSVLTIEARNMDNTSSVWPFDEEEPEIGEGTLHIGGYGFNYSCSTYNQLHSSGGWQFGTGSKNYIEFPAMEGRRLSRVTFYDYNNSAKPYIAYSTGKIVAGGEPKSYEKKEKVEFTLSDTAPDTSYRIYIGTDKTFRLWLLEMEYVK